MASRKKRKRDARRQVELDFRKWEKRQRLRQSLGPQNQKRPYTNEEKPGPSMADAKYANLSQKSKTLLFTDLFTEAYGVVGDEGVLKISRTPSPSEVRKLAEEVMNFWPKDWREGTISPVEGFNVLLWANQTPNTVANALTRCSLYADRILICNPCTNLLLYHPQQSPLICPEAWSVDYALSAMFLALVRPWVEADIVELVQNPVSFDVKLFSVYRRALDERFDNEPALRRAIDETMPFADMVAEMLMQRPNSEWQKVLSSLPMTAEQRDDALKTANSRAKEDPVRASIPQWLGTHPKEQVLCFGNGLSYPQAVAIAVSRKSQVVAYERFESRMLELDSEQLTGSFQQAAHSLSQVPLPFLNNVTTDFAIGLRKDGRMRNFRQYISDLTHGIQFRDSENQYSAQAAKEFAEKFEVQYGSFREEWKDIQRKLAAGAIGGALSAAASGAAAYLSGSLELYGTLAIAASVGITTAVGSVFDRRKLERSPLGVVLNLEKRQ